MIAKDCVIVVPVNETSADALNFSLSTFAVETNEQLTAHQFR